MITLNDHITTTPQDLCHPYNLRADILLGLTDMRDTNLHHVPLVHSTLPEASLVPISILAETLQTIQLIIDILLWG